MGQMHNVEPQSQAPPGAASHHLVQHRGEGNVQADSGGLQNIFRRPRLANFAPGREEWQVAPLFIVYG